MYSFHVGSHDFHDRLDIFSNVIVGVPLPGFIDTAECCSQVALKDLRYQTIRRPPHGDDLLQQISTICARLDGTYQGFRLPPNAAKACDSPLPFFRCVWHGISQAPSEASYGA